MGKLLLTTPKNDGFYMPIESTKHQRTWMMWPHMKDNWHDNGKPAQEVFANVANAIAQHESITMIVNPKEIQSAKKLLSDKVDILEMEYNDSWARDIAPIFLVNDKGEKRAVNFKFAAWGLQREKELNKHFKEEGLYWDYTVDDDLSVKVSKEINVDYYKVPMVLEAGSIHVDGEGTLYTTEECLLNENRNPDLTKDEIESVLKEYLNVEKVIWIPRGVYHDETNGHVDNLMHVIKPGHVLLTWTDDKNDPQYERSLEAYNFLTSQTDAKGRKIEVTKIHQPSPLIVNKDDKKNGFYSPAFATRMEGFRMPASYANFYIINGAILLPIFHDEVYDQKAIKTLQESYPDRKIIPIYAREILLGGGNIHCITQNEL